MGHSQKYRSAVGRLFSTLCVKVCVLWMWLFTCGERFVGDARQWQYEIKWKYSRKRRIVFQNTNTILPKKTSSDLFLSCGVSVYWSKQRNEGISSDTCLWPFRLSHNTLFLCVWRGKSVLCFTWWTNVWMVAGWMNELRDEWIEVLDEQMDEHMEGQIHKQVC